MRFLCGLELWDGTETVPECVRPSQCRHLRTRQSLGWTSQKPQQAGCCSHVKTAPHPRPNGSARLPCGSGPFGPLGRIWSMEEAGKSGWNVSVLVEFITDKHLSTSSYKELTFSTSNFLLASPMLLRAMSTSFCPGKQFTQLFREWETAFATWKTALHTLPSITLQRPREMQRESKI